MTRIAIFSTKLYDREYFDAANESHSFKLKYFEASLSLETAQLADGFETVCVFVNDDLNSGVIERLSEQGVQTIALRCAGFNNVDLEAAKQHGLRVVRVPAYSPHAVAEHAVALLLSLNRHLHRAYNRVRDGNFSLNGLVGFDMAGKTVGIVGTGKIGATFARIMAGFGCELLGFDKYENDDCKMLGLRYVELSELLVRSEIISLHCPLTEETYHLIDEQAIEVMKQGAVILNTGRGAVLDTKAVIAGLKQGKIGALGIDVYEEEAGLFFEDRSEKVLADDVLARLLTFPNVLITGHQGFLTHEALTAIAETTLANVAAIQTGECENEVDR
ncbi:2-hydroxyacid dehydrogenase [Adhaeretor mobilis]|nr:2-hydroxyacid dehydrogenase [Adhaeretor mobilis]